MACFIRLDWTAMRNILLVLGVVLLVAGAYVLGGRDSANIAVDDFVAPVKELAAEEAKPLLPEESNDKKTGEEKVVGREVVNDNSSAEEAKPFDIEGYNASRAAKRWSIYLGDDLSALEFIDYDVLAFDAHAHPKIRPLEHQGKAILARMNFFYLDEVKGFYTDKEKEAVLFTEKKNGESMMFVDIRSSEWLRIMIEKKIPHLTNMGFNGLLLEGVEDALLLERSYPNKYYGMIEALGRFIRTVRQHFPYLKVMLKDSVNAASVAREYVDMILLVQDGDDGVLSEKDNERTSAWVSRIKATAPDVGGSILSTLWMWRMLLRLM